VYIFSRNEFKREDERFCVVVSHVFSFYFITSEKKNKRFRPRPFRLKKDKIFSFSCRQSFCFVVLPSHQFIEENEHDDDDDDDVFARCCRCVPPTNSHQEFHPDEGSACCSRCSQKKSAVERNWSRRTI
jgi:hypothetical protein